MPLREALLSSTRLLPVKGDFCVCHSPVVLGAHSTVSHAAAVVAAETGRSSVLAPLSAVGPSGRLPSQALAVGLPPQAFLWGEQSLIRPTARPVPRELRPPVKLPLHVKRAIQRMKVQAIEGRQPLVTGACGFLGRRR